MNVNHKNNLALIALSALLNTGDIQASQELTLFPERSFSALLAKFGAFDNQHVSVKGFLYATEDANVHILASQPNLKSCCREKHPTIEVHGTVPAASAYTPVRVSGVLSILEDKLVLDCLPAGKED